MLTARIFLNFSSSTKTSREETCRMTCETKRFFRIFSVVLIEETQNKTTQQISLQKLFSIIFGYRTVTNIISGKTIH